MHPVRYVALPRVSMRVPFAKRESSFFYNLLHSFTTFFILYNLLQSLQPSSVFTTFFSLYNLLQSLQPSSVFYNLVFFEYFSIQSLGSTSSRDCHWPSASTLLYPICTTVYVQLLVLERLEPVVAQNDDDGLQDSSVV
jgi:hypothetical protein